MDLVTAARIPRSKRALLGSFLATSMAAVGIICVADADASEEGGSSRPLIEMSEPYAQHAQGDGLDLSRYAKKLTSLDVGTIAVRFKTTQKSPSAALLSASYTKDPSTNLTLSVRNGHIYWEVRDQKSAPGGWLAKADAEDAGSVSDGVEHTAAITVSNDNTRIYLDGQQVFSAAARAFFSSLNRIDSLRLGANYDNSGRQWGFDGQISKVSIYGSPLSAQQIKAITGYPQPVFSTDKSAPIPSAVRRTADNQKLTLLYTVESKGTGNNELRLRRGQADVQILSLGGSLVFSQGGQKLEVPLNKGLKPGDTIAVAIDSDEIGLYLNGSYLTSRKMPARSLASIDNYAGEGARLRVYEGRLNTAQIQSLSSYQNPGEIALFDLGYEGAASYRIPAIIRTQSGTLIASADQRVPNAYDSPNDINLVVRRSSDNGKTWKPLQKLVDLPGEGKKAASVIDSSLVQDRKSGRITLLVDLYPGGVGQPNNGPGTGMGEDGSLLLRDGANGTFKYKAGRVLDSQGRATDYSIDALGNVRKKGRELNSIYDPAEKSKVTVEGLFMVPTAYLVEMHSDDDGVTWTTPRHINNQVKADWMKFIGTSPGSAMQVRGGKYDGRLIVPIYYSNSVATVYSSAVVYSDDGGENWRRSKSPNDGRHFKSTTIDSKTVHDRTASLHESAVVQTGENELTMYMRNLNPGRKIAVSRSQDGGVSWSEPEFKDETPDIFSLPAARSMSHGYESVLFANASAAQPYRGKGVLRVSLDGGASWHSSRTFQAGHYVYQSMAMLPNGNIGLLWEREWQGIYYTEIPAEWVTEYPVRSF
ncbi:sialidase family protein [Winkia neuii]|uniref:sialidase family protein n=1 Tax=Winkia neuii TaxID=33007 RepID=UPI000ADD2D09|nr:sialidase family protein [Winkia neuii]